MQHLEVSGAVRHIYIYIYVIRRLHVNFFGPPVSNLVEIVSELQNTHLFRYDFIRCPLPELVKISTEVVNLSNPRVCAQGGALFRGYRV